MLNFTIEFKRLNGEEVKRKFKVDKVLKAIERYMTVRECLSNDNKECKKSNYNEGIATDIILKSEKGNIILRDIIN